ncbi:MAG: ThuA domain-containing protein [Clostridia bacterium]|nr:ThuA domain-containing protein [Clostridia bacterium]
MAIRVTIWNEFRHEKRVPEAMEQYPDGLHACVGAFLSKDEEIEVTLAALDDEANGLPDEVLNNTDVLMWWGHMCHNLVPDDLVERIYKRVVEQGMGFIAMHSAHFSKPFRRLTGMPCALTWGDNMNGIVWNVMPNHPIAKGIPLNFGIYEELYSEPFSIPTPDELIFATWFESGNIFRGGVTYYRGLGKIFYFHPGHETCPSFHNPIVQKILTNAVHWAAPNATGEGCLVGDVHQTTAVTDVLFGTKE